MKSKQNNDVKNVEKNDEDASAMKVEAEEQSTAPSSKENTVDVDQLVDRSTDIDTEGNDSDDISTEVNTEGPNNEDVRDLVNELEVQKQVAVEEATMEIEFTDEILEAGENVITKGGEPETTSIDIGVNAEQEEDTTVDRGIEMEDSSGIDTVISTTNDTTERLKCFVEDSRVKRSRKHFDL